MKKLVLIFLPLLIIGCGSFEKRHFKAVKFFNENESLAAEFCSGKFPSQTEYIKGEPIITIDSIFIDVPFEVDCPDGTKIKDNKKVPCNQKTITITDTLRTPDLAREKVLNDKINDCNADNVLLKKENERIVKALKNSQMYNWVLGVLCGIFIIILIKKR